MEPIHSHQFGVVANEGKHCSSNGDGNKQKGELKADHHQFGKLLTTPQVIQKHQIREQGQSKEGSWIKVRSHPFTVVSRCKFQAANASVMFPSKVVLACNVTSQRRLSELS